MHFVNDVNLSIYFNFYLVKNKHQKYHCIKVFWKLEFCLSVQHCHFYDGSNYWTLLFKKTLSLLRSCHTLNVGQKWQRVVMLVPFLHSYKISPNITQITNEIAFLLLIYKIKNPLFSFFLPVLTLLLPFFLTFD